MPFYRMGDPGQDETVHINYGGNQRRAPGKCLCNKFPEDRPAHGYVCGRPATLLCDGPGCDLPICQDHATRHPTRGNTDYCPKCSHMANYDDKPQRIFEALLDTETPR